MSKIMAMMEAVGDKTFKVSEKQKNKTSFNHSSH